MLSDWSTASRPVVRPTTEQTRAQAYEMLIKGEPVEHQDKFSCMEKVFKPARVSWVLDKKSKFIVNFEF